MVKFYRTDDKLIHELDTLQGGTWIQMVNPSVAEGQMVADDLNVDIEDVLAALDEEESSRIELQDGYTLILVDIPSIETRHDKESYTTIPLGTKTVQNAFGFRSFAVSRHYTLPRNQRHSLLRILHCAHLNFEHYFRSQPM